jgi:hypothetical protein
MSRKFKAWRFLSPPLMRALPALIVTLVFMCETSQAQEKGKNPTKIKHLGIHLGVGIASYREDLLVPLSFDGPALSLGAVYTRRTEKNLIHFRLRIGAGYLENRYSHEAWVLILEMRPSWMRKLGQHQKYGEFWGGICLPLQMNNLFIESWDDAHLYWLTAHSLGVATEWQKKISEKSSAVFRVETPLLGFVSRPPEYRYKKQEALTHWTFHITEPNRSLHLETLNTYRVLFIQMLFSREMRCSLLNLGLEFEYKYCRKPQKIWGLNTSILLSYQWRIGR